MNAEELLRRWNKDKERLEYIREETKVLEKDMDEITSKLAMYLVEKKR